MMNIPFRTLFVILLLAAPVYADEPHREGQYGGVPAGEVQPRDTSSKPARPKRPPPRGTLTWIGFAAKRGTAPEITSQLNKAINKVLAEPKIRASLDKIGAIAVGGTAAEFGEGVRTDIAHWAKIVKDADIKLP